MTRQVRRTVELLAACYGWWWAFNLSLSYAMGSDPLWWAGLDYWQGLSLVWIMGIGSALAALGERINGRWRWSPLLRAVGLLVMGSVVGTLAVHGITVTATAWANYSALWAMLWLGSAMALSDLRKDVNHAKLA